MSEKEIDIRDLIDAEAQKKDESKQSMQLKTKEKKHQTLNESKELKENEIDKLNNEIKELNDIIPVKTKQYEKLAETPKKLKEGYSESEKIISQMKEVSSELDEVYKEKKDALSEMGVNSKAEMIRFLENNYGTGKQIKEYREGGKSLKSIVKELIISKEKAYKEHPELGLDFTAKKRQESMAKLTNKIDSIKNELSENTEKAALSKEEVKKLEAEIDDINLELIRMDLESGEVDLRNEAIGKLKERIIERHENDSIIKIDADDAEDAVKINSPKIISDLLYEFYTSKEFYNRSELNDIPYRLASKIVDCIESDKNIEPYGIMDKFKEEYGKRINKLLLESAEDKKDEEFKITHAIATYAKEDFFNHLGGSLYGLETEGQLSQNDKEYYISNYGNESDKEYDNKRKERRDNFDEKLTEIDTLKSDIGKLETQKEQWFNKLTGVSEKLKDQIEDKKKQIKIKEKESLSDVIDIEYFNDIIRLSGPFSRVNKRNVELLGLSSEFNGKMSTGEIRKKIFSKINSEFNMGYTDKQIEEIIIYHCAQSTIKQWGSSEKVLNEVFKMNENELYKFVHGYERPRP